MASSRSLFLSTAAVLVAATLIVAGWFWHARARLPAANPRRTAGHAAFAASREQFPADVLALASTSTAALIANLQLSQRRAASVVAALTGQYGIAATRLSSSGAGESRPKDTNDTLEGRAHNRRVELVRR